MSRTEEPGSIENAVALTPFFEQLASGQPLHILHFGDSHTASDDWANAMRVTLQSRFGNGGPGFALAGHPFLGYRRYDITGGSTKLWRTEGTLGHLSDGRYGLGGVSIATSLPGQIVTLKTECAELKLYYLRQPGGGNLSFAVDGAEVWKIATDGDAAPAYFAYTPAAGPHQYTLKTLDAAPVKLFGWSAENRSGITYEDFGINGAQASMILAWDEQILADHLAQRNPALIVVAYGTNEAVNARWTPESLSGDFGRVLERFQHAAPKASMLVIGPPDGEFRSHGRLHPGRLSDVTAVMREVALNHGCAFWDWRERMGGAGSIAEWVKAGYAQPDRIHLSGSGYKLIGEMLVKELLEQYGRFQAEKPAGQAEANGQN